MHQQPLADHSPLSNLAALSLLWSRLVHCPMTEEQVFWMLLFGLDLQLMQASSLPLKVIHVTSSSGVNASESTIVGDKGIRTTILASWIEKK
jgi:hypothetical protein